MTLRDETAVQWFVFCRVAVAVRVGRFAFALWESGWQPAHPYGIEFESEPLADGDAAAKRFCLVWADFDPATIESFVRFGMAPPRSRRIRGFVCIEQALPLNGATNVDGRIFAELDDRTLQPISGWQLAALAKLKPGIKKWRLEGRTDFQNG